jgi:hypothetical protein
MGAATAMDMGTGTVTGTETVMETGTAMDTGTAMGTATEMATTVMTMMTTITMTMTTESGLSQLGTWNAAVFDHSLTSGTTAHSVTRSSSCVGFPIRDVSFRRSVSPVSTAQRVSVSISQLHAAPRRHVPHEANCACRNCSPPKQLTAA